MCLQVIDFLSVFVLALAEHCRCCGVVFECDATVNVVFTVFAALPLSTLAQFVNHSNGFVILAKANQGFCLYKVGLASACHDHVAVSITLLSSTATIVGFVDTAEYVRLCGVAAHAVGVEHILATEVYREHVGHPLTCLWVYETVSLATTSEGTVGSLVLKAWVILLVEDKHDTDITEFWSLIFGHTHSLHSVREFLIVVVAIDGLECLPHTRVVHIVEDGVCILCRTAALEVHTTDILSSLYPTS